MARAARVMCLVVQRPGLIADLAAVLRVLVSDADWVSVCKAQERARVLLREIENG